MEHVDIPLGEMHKAHNYEYADATARLAATVNGSAVTVNGEFVAVN